MPQFQKLENLITDEIRLAYFIGIVYCFQTLNYFRFYPSLRSLDLGLQSIIALSVGVFLVVSNKNFVFNKVGIGILGWVFFAAVILIQPLLSKIIYPDSLLLTIAPVVFICILTLVIYQIKDKTKFIEIIGIFIILAAILQNLTLLLQLFGVNFLYGNLVYPIPQGGRPVGNIGQPNQAAFILVLGLAALFFLKNLTEKLSEFLFVFIFLFLSMGISITSSRGGVILGVVAILVYYSLLDRSLKDNLIRMVVSFFIFTIGNLIGNFLIGISNTSTKTVIERVNDLGIVIRGYQIEQSWKVFTDNIWFGVGWNQFITTNLSYRNDLNWLSNIDHTHFILSQIAAELGLVGLLVFVPFIYIAIKYTRLRRNYHTTFILSILAIFTAYSFSEYPLWYFNFLMLFAVFIALVDSDLKHIRLKYIMLNRLILIISAFFLLVSLYYYNSYVKYTKAFASMLYDDLTWEQNLYNINSLPSVYGYTSYREQMLYRALPMDSRQLTKKIELGNRVMQFHPEPEIMIKQGILYALNGDSIKSLELFKSTCMFEFGDYCERATVTLNETSKQQPNYFNNIYNDFIKWKQQNHK